MGKAKEVDFLSAVVAEFSNDEDMIVGKEQTPQEWIDTGSYALNKIISGDYLKGYPRGKIVEIFGDTSAGKSYLVSLAIANFQKKYGNKAAIILDDTENAFMEAFAASIGVDIPRIIRRYSETVEQHFRSMFPDTRKKKPVDEKKYTPLIPFILGKDPEVKVLLALDSIAMLSTDHEKAAGFDKEDMSKPKKIRAGIRMNFPYVSKNEILYLITNHEIADIAHSTAYYQAKTTPGGKAVPFMATVRLELAVKEKFNKNGTKAEKDDDIAGVVTQAFTKKNRIAPPFKKARIRIDFEGKGVDKMSGVADLLIQDGILKMKSQGFLYIDDKRKIKESELTEEVFLQLLADTKAEREVQEAKAAKDGKKA
jgi:recombination protein RecA